jgi:hypothetical protein
MASLGGAGAPSPTGGVRFSPMLTVVRWTLAAAFIFWGIGRYQTWCSSGEQGYDYGGIGVFAVALAFWFLDVFFVWIDSAVKASFRPAYSVEQKAIQQEVLFEYNPFSYPLLWSSLTCFMVGYAVTQGSTFDPSMSGCDSNAHFAFQNNNTNTPRVLTYGLAWSLRYPSVTPNTTWACPTSSYTTLSCTDWNNIVVSVSLFVVASAIWLVALMIWGRWSFASFPLLFSLLWFQLACLCVAISVQYANIINAEPYNSYLHSDILNADFSFFILMWLVFALGVAFFIQYYPGYCVADPNATETSAF